MDSLKDPACKLVDVTGLDPGLSMVDPNKLKGKDVKVILEDTRLSVTVAGYTIIEGDLYEDVNEEDMTWTIDSDNKSATTSSSIGSGGSNASGKGKVLSIYLRKKSGMSWWGSVIKGHPAINLKKVVPESSKLDDLDAETRRMVTKMMVCDFNRSLEFL